MTFSYYALLTLLMFVAIILILLILIQKGRGGGLSTAFGGGGGGSTAFGAKTGDVLTWATSIIFGLFILLAVVLDLVVNSQYKSTANIANGSLSATPAASVPQPPADQSVPAAPPVVPPVITPIVPTPVPTPVTAPSVNLGTLPAQAGKATTQLIGKIKATTQP
jgi:preprotein translocase subunit SecG